MPSDCIWTGATDGVVTTATNYQGGAAPVAGDSVYGNIAPTNAMASGAFPNLVNFVITDAYGANNIGSASTAVTFGTVTTMTIGSRSSGIYISAGANTVITANFQLLTGGTLSVSGGTFTTTNIRSCVLEAGASAIFTNINSIGATGNVATNGTAITALTGTGRWTVTSRNITTSNVRPGLTLIVKGTTAVTTTNVQGTFLHQSSGTVSTANIEPSGAYSIAGNPGNAGTAITLSQANIWAGGTLIEAVPGLTLTVSARTYIGGQSTNPGGGLLP